MAGTFDQATFEIFGQCVSANVAATQWATDRVIEGEQRQKESMAHAFLRLFDAVDSAADVVTTRTLERVLYALGPAYEQALRIVEQAETIHKEEDD